MSLLTCACGADWWTVTRQVQIDHGDTQPTAPGCEPRHAAIRVVLVCAGCGVGIAADTTGPGQVPRASGGPHLRRDDD